ncbi:PAS domain-containing protein [Rhizobium sp. S152]|uniref:PAS domain-containing protein n=1 Tax=Rhizobium sp. S152 TaxID=3055038 RepID=UPI0025A9A9AB|nr:PAS domain-containing protein [Rhizobium sp. S152]MDM9628111.1 PAS domain-containing protein [Rhizobium sp. S152]
MRLKTTIELFDYWNRLRGAEIAPLRNEVEPTQLRNILSSLFMLEMVDSDRVVFRLAGTRICDFFGRDLGGAAIDSLWAHGCDDIGKTAAGVMTHALPALLNATGYSAAGHRAAFEIILLPLRNAEGKCDKLLGAIAPATAASWLEVVPLEFLVLDRSRLLHEELGKSSVAGEETVNGSAPTRPLTIAETVRQMMSHLFDANSDVSVTPRHN